MSTKVGYVLKVFPRVSETFVINEIRAHEEAGRAVEVFSLHANPKPVRHRILEGLRAVPRTMDDVPPDEEDVRVARKTLMKKLGLRAHERDRFLPRKYVRLALAVARAAQETGVEHLHAHFASRAGHVAVLAGLLAEVPASITGHAKDLYHDEVDRDLLRWKIDRSAFFVTVTDYNLHFLRGLVGSTPGVAGRIVRIYNGIDLARFDDGARVPSEPPLIHAVGRLIEKKGFGDLLTACRLLLDRGQRFRCAIQGDGELRAELERRAAETGLAEVVRFEGSVASEEVAERLRSASISVLPCVRGADGNVDALPTVLLEAIATGVPVVSTRLSGIPEIVVDRVNGLLVEPGDAVGLADNIELLLHEPEFALHMGQRGRTRCEQLFDLHRNAARLGELFDRGIDGAG